MGFGGPRFGRFPSEGCVGCHEMDSVTEDAQSSPLCLKSFDPFTLSFHAWKRLNALIKSCFRSEFPSLAADWEDVGVSCLGC